MDAGAKADALLAQRRLVARHFAQRVRLAHPRAPKEAARQQHAMSAMSAAQSELECGAARFVLGIVERDVQAVVQIVLLILRKQRSCMSMARSIWRKSSMYQVLQMLGHALAAHALDDQAERHHLSRERNTSSNALTAASVLPHLALARVTHGCWIGAAGVGRIDLQWQQLVRAHKSQPVRLSSAYRAAA